MMLPASRVGGMPKSVKRLVRLVHVLAISASIFIVWGGSGPLGLILLTAALLVDYMTFKLGIANEWIGAGVKLLLLLLCTGLIYSIVITGQLGGGDATGLAALSERRHHHHHHSKHSKSGKANAAESLTSGAAAAAAAAAVAGDATSRSKHAATRAAADVPLTVTFERERLPAPSRALLLAVFNSTLPYSSYPDLKYRGPLEVRRALSRVFSELPEDGYLRDFKNPCWRADSSVSKELEESETALSKRRRKSLRRRGLPSQEGRADNVDAAAALANADLHCLPYAYILGQPKCGTSDLFERLKMHAHITMPLRKEVRWFTRGEFTRSRLGLEQASDQGQEAARMLDGGGGSNQLLGPGSSVFSFTRSFANTLGDIVAEPASQITIDGGPHTFWWPTQSPDGSLLPEAIPTPQILREMQPGARFVVTLSDPVKRLYSDYHFLDDNLRVHRPSRGDGSSGSGAGVGVEEGGKSAQQLDERVREQIAGFKACVEEQSDVLKKQIELQRQALQEKGGETAGNATTDSSAEAAGDIQGTEEQASQALWFRASQVCAHDRHRFAQAGWGRLSIGLYSLYYEKWLEHFEPSSFLVLRLEDYDADPRAYMSKIFAFLDLSEPDFSAWSAILNKRRANAYQAYREPILEETEAALRDFYRPYNELLSKMLSDERFRWPIIDASASADPAGNSTVGEITLRAKQLQSAQREAAEAQHGEQPGDQTDALAGSQAQSQADKKQQAISQRRAQHRGSHSDHSGLSGIKKKWGAIHDSILHNHTVPMLLEDLDGEGGKAGSSGRNVHGRMDDQSAADTDDESDLAPPHSIKMKKKHQLPYLLPGEKASDHAAKFHARREHAGSTDPEASASRRLTLFPERFSLDNLTLPDSQEFNLWLRDGQHIDRENPIIDEEDAAEQLCVAAFALDLSALKYLLFEKGVPSGLISVKDASRNAFHCLALVHIMADAHGKSQIFALLKGRKTWLTPYLDPPLPLQERSVLARDVIESTAGAVLKVAEWLTRAGVECDLPDITGNTPLHHASAGGQTSLANYLIAHGADVNKANREGRTPLHYATAYGHSSLAGSLVNAGASLDAEDKFASTPRLIASAPGPISPADALRFLNVTQRPPKTIARLLHPERKPHAKGGWHAGTGGWGTARLQGYEEDMGCDVDQYWAHEITAKQLFEGYLSRMAPVLIRGLLDPDHSSDKSQGQGQGQSQSQGWAEAAQRYSYANLTAQHGSLRVQVSDIPYTDKFGGQPRQDMLLSEYLEQVREHRMVGGIHPWYVFKGNRIPADSDKPGSLVPVAVTPTPATIQQAVEYLSPQGQRGYGGADRRGREIFINAQWAVGGEGTGAPVHYHNTAWNALVYGAKKWALYPPHSMIMSNRQIREYFEGSGSEEDRDTGKEREKENDAGDLAAMRGRGAEPLMCVQTAGDVMIVPEIWGHGVLNLQESVAVATESKANHWRIKPASGLLSKLPSPSALL